MRTTRSVYRYQLPIVDVQDVDLPLGAQILSVGPPRSDPEVLDMWALIEVDETRTKRRQVHIVGTGHPVPDAGVRFIGTTYSHDRDLIWHVFEST